MSSFHSLVWMNVHFIITFIITSMPKKNKLKKCNTQKSNIKSYKKCSSTPLETNNLKNNCQVFDYSDYWIDCNNCGQWWHSKCVSLDKAVCNLIIRRSISIISNLNSSKNTLSSHLSTSAKALPANSDECKLLAEPGCYVIVYLYVI